LSTITGKGFIEDFTKPYKTKEYYITILSVVALFISIFTVWEICLLVVEAFRKEKEKEKQGRRQSGINF